MCGVVTSLVFITLMILLVIVIGILANIVIGAADVKLKKRKEERSSGSAAVLLLLLTLVSSSLFAQTVTPTTPATPTGPKLIGGMDASTFYVMVTVLFIELATIIALLINIKFCLLYTSPSPRD